MELKETVDMMNSEDYKERFIAEWLQLRIRIKGLTKMLKEYKEGTLSFEPVTPYEVLENQLHVMTNYDQTLSERAGIEDITLPNEG